MRDFAEELCFDMAFAGFYQVLFALGLMIPFLLFERNVFGKPLKLVLRCFALFNLFLFSWSVVGNGAWLLLTKDRFSVQDDAPIWTSFLPIGRYLLDHAAGDSDGWYLLGDTTLTQLRIIWTVTAGAVWLMTALSLHLYLRRQSAKAARQTVSL
ncbi:MAG: hypothetical protein ABIT76_13310 [Chthoniobacterales bacterium]